MIAHTNCDYDASQTIVDGHVSQLYVTDKGHRVEEMSHMFPDFIVGKLDMQHRDIVSVH